MINTQTPSILELLKVLKEKRNPSLAEKKKKRLSDTALGEPGRGLSFFEKYGEGQS